MRLLVYGTLILGLALAGSACRDIASYPWAQPPAHDGARDGVSRDSVSRDGVSHDGTRDTRPTVDSNPLDSAPVDATKRDASGCPNNMVQSCGNCGTGTQTCKAGVWSRCEGGGVCAASTQQRCGNCNSGKKTCSASCTWGTCVGATGCAPNRRSLAATATQAKRPAPRRAPGARA